MTIALVSVWVESDPSSATRSYPIYDARGDVANLADASDAVVAAYRYGSGQGALASASECIPNANGSTTPYRFDGGDRVRFDAATWLDWMATRAYGKPPAHPWSGELTALSAQVATVQTRARKPERAGGGSDVQRGVCGGADSRRE